MKQTRIIIASIIVMASVSCGCERRESRNDRAEKPRLQLTYPSQDTDSSMKIRFDRSRRKDEKALAYDRIAEEWNRNLILGSRPACEP